jgi:hypothetical protein
VAARLSSIGLCSWLRTGHVKSFVDMAASIPVSAILKQNSTDLPWKQATSPSGKLTAGWARCRFLAAAQVPGKGRRTYRQHRQHCQTTS